MSALNVTMEDIAKRVGLARSAISRALRGRPGVSAATRARVEKVAKEMGYCPDPMTSSLAEARWRGRQRRTLVNWAFLSEAVGDAELAESPAFRIFSESARSFGYSLCAVALHPGLRARTVNRLLRALSVRGVMLDGIGQAAIAREFEWKDLAWEDFAWVAVGESRYAPAVHQVLFNSLDNVQTALTKMRERGYRRIAFLQEADALSRENARQHAAFLQHQLMHPRERLAHFEVLPDKMLEGKAEARVKAFAPEALLLGYSGIQWLLPGALRSLPWASMAVLGADGAEAGIHLDFQVVAQVSAEMLDFQQRRRERGRPSRCHAMLVEGLWVDGASLPAKKGRLP